jgi:hypothetical protein
LKSRKISVGRRGDVEGQVASDGTGEAVAGDAPAPGDAPGG